MKRIIVILLLMFSFTTSNVLYAVSNKKESSDSANEIIFIKDDDYAGKSQFYETIIELGYGVDIIEPEAVTIEILNQYELVVLSTGNNTMACQSSEMRLSVQTFIIEYLGKVIIEGGHTGYISDVFPFYLGFRNKVIMIDYWVTDNGGDLVLSDVFSSYDLANVPNKLPSTITINYSTPGDQDICANNKFTQLFYKTSLYSDKVGILVSPTVQNPRVINLFNYFSAFAFREEGKMLLQNFIFNLIGKPVGIDDLIGEVPAGFRLYQNYPNPFNPVTKLEFGISNFEFVTLKVYDVLGNEVKTLVNENKPAGYYSVTFDGSNLPSGIYYYNLTAGKLFETKKMMLLK